MKRRCPKCGTSVTFGDESGATATCPRCRATLRIHIIKDESTGWEWNSAILKMQFGIHLILMFGVAWAIGSFPPGIAGDAVLTALALVLVLAYLICLCSHVAAPDSAARRYAIASVLTLILGTMGWYAAALSIVHERTGSHIHAGSGDRIRRILGLLRGVRASGALSTPRSRRRSAIGGCGESATSSWRHQSSRSSPSSCWKWCGGSCDSCRRTSSTRRSSPSTSASLFGTR